MNRTRYLGIVTAILAVAFGGTAIAQTYPQLQVTGTAPITSGALVTITLPAVVGIDVEHNFVLSLGAAGTGCWGVGAAFPMASGAGNTTFTFAVKGLPAIADTADVSCPGAGAGQPDVATIKVFSTSSATSTLKCQITDGGFGVTPSKKLSDLVPDIWSGSRLSLIVGGGSEPCGGGTKAFPVTLALAATPYTLVTAIPATPFSSCTQKLQLVLNTDTVAYTSGTATGKLTYTISTP